MRYFSFLIGLFVVIMIAVLLYFGLHHPSTSLPHHVVMADFASSDSSVSYTLNGVTDNDVEHRVVKITVNNLSSMVEILAGYQGKVVNSETFTNNQAAYKAFLASLQTEGFLLQRKVGVNLIGQCPLGLQYVFDTTGISGAPAELWTTSCGKLTGNFAGDLGAIQQLFYRQIPNYDAFVSNVNVGA